MVATEDAKGQEEGELLGIIGDGLVAHLVGQLQVAREGAARLIGEFQDRGSR